VLPQDISELIDPAEPIALTLNIFLMSQTKFVVVAQIIVLDVPMHLFALVV
jgi:hypothetical protein